MKNYLQPKEEPPQPKEEPSADDIALRDSRALRFVLQRDALHSVRAHLPGSLLHNDETALQSSMLPLFAFFFIHASFMRHTTHGCVTRKAGCPWACHSGRLYTLLRTYGSIRFLRVSGGATPSPTTLCPPPPASPASPLPTTTSFSCVTLSGSHSA